MSLVRETGAGHNGRRVDKLSVHLPPSFAFSQASLQDYADCRRRFQLRYVLGVRWPGAGIGEEEWQRQTQLGSCFHQLVHQHTMGLPPELLYARAVDWHLESWWRAYLSAPPPGLPDAMRQSEVHLSTPLGQHRLAARYDLLAIAPGQRAIIVDWKTSERRPTRAWLEGRWQTPVYRYVLAKAGAEMNGGHAFAPEQIELIYWFANHAPQIESFPYDLQQYRADEALLTEVTHEIVACAQDFWTLTDDDSRCRYCTYRTLCGREPVDGQGDEAEPDEVASRFLLDLDLEQIAEIEF